MIDYEKESNDSKHRSHRTMPENNDDDDEDQYIDDDDDDDDLDEEGNPRVHSCQTH